MAAPFDPSATVSDTAAKAIEKVFRVNQRWIVHGQLREHTAAYLEFLQKHDPTRLQRACELALRMVRHTDTIRDPKPLFYSGIFATASRHEIETYLHHHPVIRAISLLLYGDTSGRDSLTSESARSLADSIAKEIVVIRND